MPSTPGTPDYYRILQVHPEAEPDVIEAAYYRLLKKYHPDALRPDQRDDPNIQRMIREINAAYDVLGDPAKRAAYDASEAPPVAASTVEKRTIPGRCAKTGQEFEILLARKKGTTDKFKTVGFTPVESVTDIVAKPRGPLAVIGRVLAPKKKEPRPSGFGAPSDDELEAMFDDSAKINFSDIAWTMGCPVCDGSVPHAGASATTWSICGSCVRISWMGSTQIVAKQMVKVCPWCGSRHTITNLDKTGGRSKHNIRSSTVDDPDPKRLGGARLGLPKGED